MGHVRLCTPHFRAIHGSWRGARAPFLWEERRTLRTSLASFDNGQPLVIALGQRRSACVSPPVVCEHAIA